MEDFLCNVCGGSLQFISGEHMKCEYCGQIYDIDFNKVSNEQVYNKASALSKGGTVEGNQEAYELFDSILSYRNSAEKAQECINNIECLKVLEEEKQLEDRRQQEIERERAIEQEYVNKKKNRIWNVVLVCLGILIIGFCISEISKQEKLDKQYAEAFVLLNDGQVEQALEIFKSLDGFKESETYVTNLSEKLKEYEVSYKEALTRFDAKDYESALSMFKNHIKYKDSLEYINLCSDQIYHQAEDLFTVNNYEAARLKLENIPDYAECYQKTKEMANRIESSITLDNYEKAVALYNEANYLEAQKIFLNIRNFEDAFLYVEKIGENLFLKAKQAYQDSDYLQGYELLESINEEDEWSNYKEVQELTGEIVAKYKENVEETAIIVLRKSGYNEFSVYLDTCINKMYKEEDAALLKDVYYPTNLCDLEIVGGWDNMVARKLYSSNKWSEETKYTDNYGNTYEWGMNYYGSSEDEARYVEYFVKDFSTFSGIIIMNYEFMTLEYGGYVNIYGDDRLLYSSAEVKKGYIPMSFNIDISNVNILRIEFTGYFKTISIAEPCLIR